MCDRCRSVPCRCELINLESQLTAAKERERVLIEENDKLSELFNAAGIDNNKLHERERVLVGALQSLYDHSRRSRFKADAYLWEQARAALAQGKGGE